MKQIIVTGGYGFIGSNLVTELAKQGHNIIIVDNMSTGNIDNLPSGIETHIFEYQQSMQYINPKSYGRIDAIYHLGIPSTTELYRKNRMLMGRAINDFIRVMEVAKYFNCPVIWASSSSIYNGHEPPHNESMIPYEKDFYTEVRYAMERISNVYYQLHQVKSVGLRLFSVYGHNDWRKKKFANLITQAIIAKKKDIPFMVYGDGEQTRDFTYVKDVVRAFQLAEEHIKEFQWGIFNVGRGNEITVNQMLKELEIEKIKYRWNPIQNYVERTRASTYRTEEYLKFKALYSLREGIADYIRNEKWDEVLK